MIGWDEHMEATCGPLPIGDRPGLTTLITRVAAAAGLTIVQLRRHDRRPRIARVRAQAMRLARAKGFTYQEIGDALDRDPSTVVYACRDRKRPAPAKKPTFSMPPPRGRKPGRCAAVGL